LLHPFMPFMTEELWAQTGARDGLICHAEWPQATVNDNAAADEINWLIELVSQVRSLRSEMNIKPSLKMTLVVVGASDETKSRMAIHDNAIKSLARMEVIEFADAVPEGSAQIVVGEATVCLPLKGVVDLSGEQARLEKEIETLDKDIKIVSGKLGNEKFIANAPDAVVQENRDRLTECEDKKAKVLEALERIKSFG